MPTDKRKKDFVVNCQLDISVCRSFDLCMLQAEFKRNGPIWATIGHFIIPLIVFFCQFENKRNGIENICEVANLILHGKTAK